MNKTTDTNMTEIDEGYTYNYFLSASGSFIIGGVIMLVHYITGNSIGFGILGFIIFGLGIILLLIKSGTVVDEKEIRIGRYDSLFNKKKYRWRTLENCTLASISTYSISQTVTTVAQSQTINAKLYQLKFDFPNRKGVFYHEFSDYKTIVSVTNTLQKKLNIKIQNKVREQRIKAMKNIDTRRR